MLNLSELGSGSIPGITPALGNMLAEAAGVCLESQAHGQNVTLAVRGYSHGHYALTWLAIAQQALRAWNDLENATEHGAAGIAILLADRELNYTVIEASRRGTGFDYWLGHESVGMFQRKGRLEVSGIRRGDNSAIRRRVRQKLRQTELSDASFPDKPAYVIVVEFGNPVAEVRKK